MYYDIFQSTFDISGAILEMSPNSLAVHTDPLVKLKVSFLSNIFRRVFITVNV